MRINVTSPLYQTQSGWNAILPGARHIPANVHVKDFYDFVIVGAGYTGLSAARRLAELSPGASILLAEAAETGEGASARNSGFLLSVPFNTSHAGHVTAVQSATKQIRIYTAALNWLRETVNDNAIQCDWNDIGKYHAAVTDAGIARIRSLADHYRECGVACEEIEPQAFADRIGSTYYRYAFHTGNNVYVQPAALVRGLAAALPPGVDFLERSPVVSLSRVSPFKVELPQCTVTATNVIIANNGFARKFGLFKDRLFNVCTYAGMTPELSDDQLALHGSEPEWGITPAARAGTTLRRLVSRRFLVRSLHSYEAEECPAKVRALLEDCYRRRYPHLKTHRFEYVWAGAVGLSRNGESCFGRVADHLYVSAGCNGAGILKGVAYGKLLAELILGQETQDSLDVQSMNSPTWLPPDPVRRLGVALTLRRMRHQAGAER